MQVNLGCIYIDMWMRDHGEEVALWHFRRRGLREESMTRAIGQVSNLAALQSLRALETSTNGGPVFTCRSAFFGRFSFPTCDLRWSAEGKADRFVVFASGDGVNVKVETPEELLSGEWPQNFSMLNFEDLSAHLEPQIFKAEAQPSTFLADVMSKTIYTATAADLLGDIDHHFARISGLPVIDEDLKCIGVVSKKDRARAPNGLKSKVGEVMSSPAITLSAEKTVLDAAVLMLKNKIHRIPVINESGQVVGIVTRTDIFNALEGLPS